MSLYRLTTRSAEARHLASSPRLSIGQDSAEVSFWKDCAACIRMPSDMAPAMNCGAATRIGKTGSSVP
ncbi:hypothetical protein D3C78_1624960 [compost metagenome]